MAQMSWDVLPLNRISAIKRSISVVRHRAFAYRLHGIAMAQMTAMIIRTSKSADRFHVQTTSTSARTQSASLKLTCVMAKTIVVIIQMSRMNLHVLHRHSVVQSVNGLVQA